MKADIRMVAKKSGVSITTVSRVMNGTGYVADATRNRVLKTIKELEYQPNRVASNMRKKNSNYLGLIVPSITYDFFSNLAKNLEDNLHRQGFSLFLCNTNEDIKKEKHYISTLLTNRISGLILVSSDIKAIKPILKDINIPMVLIDRFNDEIQKRKNTVFISSDHYQGGKTAADQLILSGAKRLLYLMGNKKTIPQMLRENGFRESMLKNSISKSNYRILQTETSPAAVSENVIRAYMEFRFDGLFCANDRIALGALYGLIEKNIRVPEQVQVIGFDDIEIGQFLKPALSTIRQNIDRIGDLAAEKIVEMVGNEKQLNERIIIPIQYIKRNTTK